jgi:hypothetical protein
MAKANEVAFSIKEVAGYFAELEDPRSEVNLRHRPAYFAARECSTPFGIYELLLQGPHWNATKTSDSLSPAVIRNT